MKPTAASSVALIALAIFLAGLLYVATTRNDTHDFFVADDSNPPCTPLTVVRTGQRIDRIVVDMPCLREHNPAARIDVTP